MSTIYDAPGEYNLKQILEYDHSSGSYEFDLRVVWADLTTGRLLTARDSGCSCPSPFEGYYSLNQLQSVNEDCLIMLEREGLPGEQLDRIKAHMVEKREDSDFNGNTF